MTRGLTSGFIVAGCVALREITVGLLTDLFGNDSIVLGRSLVILDVTTLVGPESPAKEVSHPSDACPPQAISIALGSISAGRAEHLRNSAGDALTRRASSVEGA